MFLYKHKQAAPNHGKNQLAKAQNKSNGSPIRMEKM